jgi:hypothetical protein
LFSLDFTTLVIVKMLTGCRLVIVLGVLSAVLASPESQNVAVSAARPDCQKFVVPETIKPATSKGPESYLVNLKLSYSTQKDFSEVLAAATAQGINPNVTFASKEYDYGFAATLDDVQYCKLSSHPKVRLSADFAMYKAEHLDRSAWLSFVGTYAALTLNPRQFLALRT